MHMCVHVHTHTNTHCIDIDMHTHMHVYTHTYIYIHKQTLYSYTQTHMHTQYITHAELKTMVCYKPFSYFLHMHFSRWLKITQCDSIHFQQSCVARPLFLSSLPNIKEEKVVWLRETTFSMGHH